MIWEKILDRKSSFMLKIAYLKVALHPNIWLGNSKIKFSFIIRYDRRKQFYFIKFHVWSARVESWDRPLIGSSCTMTKMRSFLMEVPLWVTQNSELTIRYFEDWVNFNSPESVTLVIKKVCDHRNIQLQPFPLNQHKT